MTAVLTQQDFEPHLNKTFRFPGWDGSLSLARVEIGPDYPGHRRPFTAVFQGPPGHVLPEGLYLATVETGETLEFYIQPIHTPARDRQDYQAAFN